MKAKFIFILGMAAILTVLFAGEDSLRVQREYEILFEGKYDGALPIKSGTPMLLDIIKNRRYLTQSQWERVHQKTLTRPVRDSYYDTPEGHFKIHYNASEVDTHYVRRCGEFFERAWSVEVDSLGFLPPVPDGTRGGDSRVDVYITHFAYAIYGCTTPDDGGEGPAPWNDVSAYIEVNSSYEGFLPNDDPEGSDWGAFKVTCAHEFFHTVQMAYDYTEEVWMLEIASVWMEDIVYDYVNDYYNYQPSFFNSPWVSIMTYDGAHEYASAHWFHYLSENYSAEAIKAIFNKMIYSDGLAAIAEGLDSLAGLDLNREFMTFVAWNYLTGSRADSFHYEEGANYPEIYVEDYITTLPYTFLPSMAHRTASYGSNYIGFIEGLADAVHIELLGDPGAQWHYAVIIPGDTAQILFPDDSTGNFYVGGKAFAVAIFPAGTFSPLAHYNYTLTVSETTLGFVADAGEDIYLCYGDTAILGGSPSARGGTEPYQYFWRPSYGLSDSSEANPLAAPETTTLYHLIVVDAVGDTAQDSVRVIVDLPLSVSISTQETIVVARGDTLALEAEISGGTPPYQYEWYPHELFENPQDSTQTIVAGSTVTVWLEVTDFFTCAAADSVVISPTEGVCEKNLPGAVRLEAYPNPFNRAVKVILPHSGRLTIFSVDGRVIFAGRVKMGEFLWRPGSEISAGIYIIHLGNISKKVLYVP